MSLLTWNNELIGGASDRYYQLTDGALVKRCLDGDDQAWAAWLDRYGSLIYSIALKSNLPPEDVADVFQSVCLTALEGLDKLGDEPKLSSWLTTVTLWQCRQLLPSDQADGESNDFSEGTPLPEEELQKMERERLLQQAFSMLEEPSRQQLLSLVSQAEPWFDQASAPKSSGSVLTPGLPLDDCLKKFMGVLSELGFSTQR
jgi:RNA polymerase sigma-70 factor (ECF subfamily)